MCEITQEAKDLERQRVKARAIELIWNIEDCKDDLERLQSKCDHEYSVYKIGSDQCTHSWYRDALYADIECCDCQKRWTETQRSLRGALTLFPNWKENK